MAIRSLNTLPDCIRAIKELDETITRITTRNVDFHGRQIKNAGPSKDDFDYVIRKELRDALAAQKPSTNGATGDITVNNTNNTISRTGDFLNVLDFIDPGDYASIADHSITTSLLTEIQDAIDTARSTQRGILYFPGGLYPIGTGDGLVVYDNLILMGDGIDATVIFYEGNGVAITYGDDAELRRYTGGKDFRVQLGPAAGMDAGCIEAVSSLFVSLDNVDMTTDAPWTDPSDTTYHNAFNQFGLLLHGGNWGSLRGLVSVTGLDLEVLAGDEFGPWFAHDDQIFIGGNTYLVDFYTDPTHITLQSAPGDTAEIEYTSFQHGFGAFFSWKDCKIRGMFKNGLKADGTDGWGFQSSIFTGGAIVWTGTTVSTAPAGFGYYGVNVISGALSTHLVNVENWDVNNELQNPLDLVVHRNEGYRTAAVRLRAAGPPNCTIGGSHTFAVFVIGDQLEVHNPGLAGYLTDDNIGDTVIVERADTGYGDLTTTIASVEGPTNATLADSAVYYALHEHAGAGTTRFFAGSAFSALGGVSLIDETDGEFSAFGSDLTLNFIKNRFLRTTAHKGSIIMEGNDPFIFNKTQPSSGIIWKSGDYGTVFSQSVANIVAGVVTWVSDDQFDPAVYKAGVSIFVNNTIQVISHWTSVTQFEIVDTGVTVSGADLLLSPVELAILPIGNSLWSIAGIRDKIFTNIVAHLAGNGSFEVRGATTGPEPNGALRMKIDSGSIKTYMAMEMQTNNGFSFITLGGSSGVFWFDSSPALISKIYDAGGGLQIGSGRSGSVKDITLDSYGGAIIIKRTGTTVVTIDNNGITINALGIGTGIPAKFNSAGALIGSLIDLSSAFDVSGTAAMLVGQGGITQVIVLAKLTGGGSNGTATFSNGLLVAYSAPT